MQRVWNAVEVWAEATAASDLHPIHAAVAVLDQHDQQVAGAHEVDGAAAEVAPVLREGEVRHVQHRAGVLGDASSRRARHWAHSLRHDGWISTDAPATNASLVWSSTKPVDTMPGVSVLSSPPGPTTTSSKSGSRQRRYVVANRTASSLPFAGSMRPTTMA